MASSRSEVDTVREQLAGSLAAKMEALNGAAGRRSVSVGGASPGVQPGSATPMQTTSFGMSPATGEDLLKAIKAMSEQNAQQQEENALLQRQVAALVSRFTDIINRWDTAGLPEERVLA